MKAFRQSEQGGLGALLSQRRAEMMATPEQVAQWSGLSEARVAQIEAGNSMSAWEFEELARALAVDSGALVHGESRHSRRSLARFRCTPGARSLQAPDLRLLALGAEASRIGGFLARGLSRPIRLQKLRQTRPVQDHEEPWKQGYLLGEAARRQVFPPEPILDLEGALEGLGVHVARVDFQESSLEAASLWIPEALPVVLINRSAPADSSSLSRRALLAHELCHLLHDSGEQDPIAQLTWDEDAAGWKEEIEQRARAFAPAFLAPRDEVRHWFRAGEGRAIHRGEDKVRALARRWGFSLKGAVWHAKNCQVIQSATAERLIEALARDEHDWERIFEGGRNEGVGGTSWTPPESWRLEDSVSPVFAGLIGRLVHQAAAAGIISEGRAKEILTWR